MGQHWYCKDGKPHHTIIGKNGKERNTTVRDAKKQGWLPSVTGVIDQLDKPALTNWKLSQLANVMANYTFGQYLVEGEFDNEEMKDEYESDYIKLCKTKAMQSSIIARDEGARIHKAIEDVYNEEDCLEEYVPHVHAVQKLIKDSFGERIWHTEKTFASELGYGGTADLFCQAELQEGSYPKTLPAIFLDFKTKDFGKKPPKGYPEQKMQLEACANGLGLSDALIGNVFVSRTNIGCVHIEMYDKEDYFEQFKLLLELWKRRNNYGINEERQRATQMPFL